MNCWYVSRSFSCFPPISPLLYGIFHLFRELINDRQYLASASSVLLLSWQHTGAVMLRRKARGVTMWQGNNVIQNLSRRSVCVCVGGMMQKILANVQSAFWLSCPSQLTEESHVIHRDEMLPAITVSEITSLYITSAHKRGYVHFILLYHANTWEFMPIIWPLLINMVWYWWHVAEVQTENCTLRWFEVSETKAVKHSD